MPERRLVVVDPSGLHARPAARFVQSASRFASRIVIRRDGREADAKSLTAVLSLAIRPLSEITLTADGPDAEEALSALVADLAPYVGQPRLSVLIVSTMGHERLRDYAAHIESLGYDGIWYADERFYHEPYVGLAAMALATSTITLGVAVADPYTRHPALVAAALNSLDELSKGRAVLGYGAGDVGLENLGLKLDRPARAMREGIEIIRRLWSGEHVDYAGDLLSISDGWMHVDTRPDIPVCIAADGPGTLRLAGSVGDSVMIPHCRDPRLLQEKLRFVAEGVERSGRVSPPRVVIRLDTSVADDPVAAREAAKVKLGRLLWRQFPRIEYLETLGLELPSQLELRLREAGAYVGTQDLDVYRRFADAIPDELVEPVVLAGTPSDVSRQMDELYAAGVDEIAILPIVPVESNHEAMVELLMNARRAVPVH
jgi:5,10-methylenetetrahydromethanopterin reductase